MRVGWIGLGKLGLPCALALDRHGEYGQIEVIGYDRDPMVAEVLAGQAQIQRREQGMERLIETHNIDLALSVSEVVDGTEGIVFVAVQTPHDAAYGGEQPMPHTVQDFDYTALVAVAREISAAADYLEREITMVVISTALPGTMRREVLPVLSSRVKLIYNPFFIAMGTTIRDFIQPEFILVGADDERDAEPLRDLYAKLYAGQTVDDLYHPIVPVRTLSLESAELTKVAYNTFISMKITFANTLLEICEGTGADVDDVTETLSLATRRVISPMYLSGGMGDGGACHPRDNIAMAWLAEELGLSADPFRFVTRAREAQTNWLAARVIHEALNRELPIVILGKSYKPGSDLTYGSPALLLAHYLRSAGIEFEHWDPYVDDTFSPIHLPAVFVIATKHQDFQNLKVADGSAIIDPHRYIHPWDGIEVVHLGRGPDY
jgi:UDPglucose 6-dehydrogenase